MNSHTSRYVFTLLALFAFTLFGTNEAIAQKKEKPKKEVKPKLSKDEKKAKADEEKALNAEVKAFGKNLESFKNFKNAKVTAENENGKLKTEVARIKETQAQCDKDVEGLRADIEELMRKLKACEEKGGTNTPSVKESSAIPTKGIYFTVQVGAFQKTDIETNPDNPNFRKENADGYSKYVMGVFNNVQQADAMRDFISKLDFRQPNTRPVLVPYKDGVRISLEDALGAEQASKYKK